MVPGTFRRSSARAWYSPPIHMPVSWFMARQFARPRGLFGRLLLGGMLDRANVRSNALMFDVAAVGPAERVLEVGFGGGDLLVRLAGTVSDGQVEGVELSQPMLRRVRARIRRRGLADRVRLHAGSVEALPFDAGRFDCACSANTIYFWPDLHRGLAELARVLRPGGRLVLGFGSDVALRRAGYEERGFILYTPEQIEAALRANGLEPSALERLERREPERGTWFVSRSERAEAVAR